MKTSTTHLKRAFLILFVCLMGMAKAIAQSFTFGDLNYSVNDDGTTVTVTGHVDGFTATGSLVIPENVTYQGMTYVVTAIGDFAFYGYGNLSGTLTIPASIIEIGDNAFCYCHGFTGDLVIPNSITSIGEDAFMSCDGFTGSLTLSASLTSIQDYTFYDCNFTGTLTIPSAVTSIGNWAFLGCNGFTGDLILPNALTSIGNGAFYGCRGFEQLSIPDAVTAIGSEAFAWCWSFYGELNLSRNVERIGEEAFFYCPFSAINVDSQNTHYKSGNGVLFTHGMDTLMQYPSGKYGTLYSIPNSVTRISAGAFSGCYDLTSITIPNSVVSIGAAAFFGTHAYHVIDNGVYIGKWCLGLEDNSISTLNIEEGTRGIADEAFMYSDNLTGNLNIPNSVVFIGYKAFYGCNFTGALVIPDSVETIGEEAFFCCDDFSGEFVLGNSVTSIGKWAFAYCTGVNGSLTIPSSTISIGEAPFMGCDGIEHIAVNLGNTLYDSRNGCNAIIETTTNTLINGCKSTIIPNSVASIGNYAFAECQGLTGSLNIPNSVVTIGNEAFAGCSGLTDSLIIGNSVITIGSGAFFRCSSFTSLSSLAETPPSLSHDEYDNCDVFDYNIRNIPVYVPSGTIEVYQNAFGWNEFTNYIEMEAPVPPTEYISDGLIMYLDGIYNTRNGHDTTATVWEDLMGNYDLTVSNYSSYTWEDNHFIGLGDGGYLNTGHTWQYFNSLNDDITFEIVTYIDCDKTSPGYRGLVGWHSDNDGTNCQNDQGYDRMQTLGELPVSDADDQIATVSYTRNNGSFLNGVWKTNANTIPSGINSNQTVVFGNSWAQCRCWNDSIYCIRMYNRTLTPEEIAYNHSIDVERFGAGNGGNTGIHEENYQPTQVYPNPAHDKLFVKASEPIMLVEIYTATGNLMYKHANRCNETEISVNDFAPGVYVIRIVSETSTETKRLIVE